MSEHKIETWNDLYALLLSLGYKQAVELIESWRDEYLAGGSDDALPRERR